MTKLTFRGVHSDGEHLQLSDAAGNDYLLPIDESLYAALRAQRIAAVEQKRERDGQPIRPRDIQAMIRSGMTADDVAEFTGEPLEHIRRYEHPVLAERGHIAQQARETLVYPDSAPGDSPTPLNRLCEERLKLRSVDIETMSWDAWKQNNGTWYVELSFIAADRRRRAGWEYSRGSMTPLDDEARWLADSGPTDSGPIPNFGSGTERAYNAAHHTAGSDAGTASPLRDHQAETGRILESLRRRRSRQADSDGPVSHSAPQDAPDAGPGLAPVDAAADAPAPPAPQLQSRGRLHAVADEPAPRPDGAHTALSAPQEAEDAGRLPLPPENPTRAPADAGQSTFDIFNDQPSLLDEPGVSDDRNSTQPIMPTPADAAPGDSAPAAPSAADASEADAESADESAAEESKKKNGRSSVPSWDEIMFGTKRD
ncbi:septation protein SepH [Brevibacterium otitidis]|uniref:Septation protein SepH n=1 Tax=Brevibacterium otitidis TaxID=53364 RepID=A0ABV5X7N0_9MICO|nr:septation protein SepH [Brevibacterium otitidis]